MTDMCDASLWDGLDCPEPVRVDERLGEEIDARLLAWTGDVGTAAGWRERLRRANIGRMIMLTYPDTDDLDRLMLAGRYVVAGFALDDIYCDEDASGPCRRRPRPALRSQPPRSIRRRCSARDSARPLIEFARSSVARKGQ